jgi:hypothetical protein
MPAPTISSLSPSSMIAGTFAQITVTGTGFDSTAVVSYGGGFPPFIGLTTTYVSPTEVTAIISAQDFPFGTTTSIRVSTVSGGASAPSTFTINNPIPDAQSVIPSHATAGSGDMVVTVTGTGFTQTSVIRFGGGSRPTTYISTTKLSATMTSQILSNAGQVFVTVFNPTPGGGTSGIVGFFIDNPTPTLASISPNSATAGSGALTMTATGTSFQQAYSSIQFAGTTLVTTFVSSTTLTATVPASALATGGLPAVRVFTDLPGGGASASRTFTVNNPAPVIASIVPAAKIVGDVQFSLAVNGSGFVPTSSVQVDGSGRATTFVDSTRLTAVVLAADLAVVGTRAVRVSNPTPGGGLSLVVNLTVGNPVPTITSLLPTAKDVGTAGFTLVVDGTGFLAGSVVRWNGSARVTTLVSATRLTAAIIDSDLAAAASIDVTVVNPTPGGGASAPAVFTVGNPLPVISSLSPVSTAAGGGPFTLTVNGSGFMPGSVSAVLWNGQARTTTFVSVNRLTAAIVANDITLAGQASVTVLSSAPGGGTSNVASFFVGASNPAPTISSLAPTNADAGSAQIQLQVNGSNFVPASEVHWSGVALATTYSSSSVLLATVPAALLASPAAIAVTVFNPLPGGGTSSSATFTVNALNPVPVLSSLSPSSVVAGSGAFTLHVYGSNFIAASTVYWAGASRTTTFVSAGELTAAILAGDVTGAGTPTVTVVNPTPGGGTSNGLIFTTVAGGTNPIPSITSISPASKTVGDTGFTLTVNGNGFVSGATTVNVNGASRTTAFVSGTQVTATMLTADSAAAGVFQITAVNAGPGGGTSNAVDFTVNPATNPRPTVASINPSAVVRGAATFQLAIDGVGFVPASTVKLDGTNKTTGYVSGTKLTATIPNTDVAFAPGVLTKVNPWAHVDVKTSNAENLRAYAPGTASDPAVTVGTDGSGLYAPAPGQLSFSSAGEEALRLGGATSVLALKPTAAAYQNLALANGNNDDMVVAAPVVRLTGGGGSAALRSVVAIDRAEITLVNTTASNVTIPHDTGGVAANRFYTPGGTTFTLTPGSSARWWRDPVDLRWRLAA